MSAPRRGSPLRVLWTILGWLLSPLDWLMSRFARKKRPTTAPAVVGRVAGAAPAVAPVAARKRAGGISALPAAALGFLVAVIGGALGAVLGIFFGGRKRTVSVPPVVSLAIVGVILLALVLQGVRSMRLGAKTMVARWSPPPRIEVPLDTPPKPPADPEDDVTPTPPPPPEDTTDGAPETDEPSSDTPSDEGRAPVPEPPPAPKPDPRTHAYRWKVPGTFGSAQYERSFAIDQTSVEAAIDAFGAPLSGDVEGAVRRGLSADQSRPGFVLYGVDYRWLADLHRDDVAPIAKELSTMAEQEGYNSAPEQLAFLAAFVQAIDYCVPSDWKNPTMGCADKGCTIATPCQQDDPRWPPTKDERQAAPLTFTGGVLTPLDSLARQWGDCDTKSVLLGAMYASIGVRSVVLTDDQHAMLAVESQPRGRQKAIRWRGGTFVVIESTTPWPVGEVGSHYNVPGVLERMQVHALVD